ncbi:MAG TPA: glycine-rich protein [Thermoleophilaceae bacterium]
MRRKAVTIAIATLAGVVFAGALAQADGPRTQTFTYVGHEQTFTVSTGVAAVRIEAVGGPGGAGFNVSGEAGSLGGPGGLVLGEVPVTPGQVLRVWVGGPGLDGGNGIAGAGGFNGGAAGSVYGGGGGGASDVRTDSSLESRIVVAAGGGGGAFRTGTPVTNGGAAGQPGGSVGNCTGGGAGTGGAGGAGGTTGGGAGALGIGGGGGIDATSGNTGGGGGGGGLYGGGGGGVTTDQGASSDKAFCSGGGGANGFAAGVTATSSGVASSALPSVTLTEIAATGTSPTTTDTITTTTPAPTSPAKPALAGVTIVSVRRGGPVLGVANVGNDRSALQVELVFRRATGKRITVGRTVRAPVKAGTAPFNVPLNRPGKALLKKEHRLRLAVVVTVTPPQGAIGKITKVVTVRR